MSNVCRLSVGNLLQNGYLQDQDWSILGELHSMKKNLKAL